MRHGFLLIGLLGIGACAGGSSPQTEEGPARQSVIFSDPGSPTLVAEKPRAVGLTLDKPPAVVWAAVKRVYADLDVPVAVENPASHQLGNNDFYKTHQFGGRSMTEFVDCGTGMTGPKAADYRIYMSLLTTVAGDGNGGTVVKTTFVASGKDMGGTSSDRIVCGTTGRAESMFLDRVKTIVGG